MNTQTTRIDIRGARINVSDYPRTSTRTVVDLVADLDELTIANLLTARRNLEHRRIIRDSRRFPQWPL